MLNALKFWSSPRSNSSFTPERRPGYTPSALGHGSSKADYARSLNGYGASTSRAQSYYDDDHDSPPSYSPPQSGVRFDNRLAGVPTPRSYKSCPSDSTGESPLKALENYDIVMVFDDSYSMLNKDRGRTRWDQAWDALTTLVRVGADYDRDGIDVHFLNQRKADRSVQSEADVQRLRREIGIPGRKSYTPIGEVLETLLLAYQKQTGDSPGRPGVKKRIFLVITDGASSDAPEYPIIEAAKFFERGRFPLDQVGVQFIQVGDDQSATEFLQELDDDLAGRGNTRDIVDTIKSNGTDLEGDALVKALTGGFNRRQDKASGKRR